MCHCRAGWLFNCARFLINMSNLNNNPSLLRTKRNNTHPPNILLKFNLKEQSQPEILTEEIFTLLCTRWATALRYQMIAYSVFPGVDSGVSKLQCSTVEAQALWHATKVGTCQSSAGLEAPQLCFVFRQLPLLPQITTNSLKNNPSWKTC